MEDPMPKEPSGNKTSMEMEPMTGASPDKDDSNEGGGGVELKQKLSLINGITVIVGSIIGSGIFVSPKGVLMGTGSVGMSLIVWLLSGVYSMIGAYCYAELGTAIVRSGADYAYIFEAFGPFLAFLRLWVECMIVRPCSQAIVALTFAYYVIEPLFPDCDQPDVAVRLLAVICISEYSIIVCLSVCPIVHLYPISEYSYGSLCICPIDHLYPISEYSIIVCLSVCPIVHLYPISECSMVVCLSVCPIVHLYTISE
ncbi:large neutral amino acids transporter small subunit 2 [Plakobranchus ocellatus]|uniref:Large neutral amino acids transporter small subunit 2 n=1 Tax=Plakobranchus ocellatus TaxID=259542 RepID=A0AAV3Y544_9GAST|nr:large neutral amino acids transporter small subunit 2 [Plakobranchus ocellatus]